MEATVELVVSATLPSRRGMSGWRRTSTSSRSSRPTAPATRSARDQLVERYMPLVKSLAARYSGRGEPQEDLVQVGSIGLLLSIERFDTERGVQFTTYAVPTIVGEIQRHFRDRAWALHVPRRMKELSVRLTRTVESLTAELGRAPTIAELAEATGAEEDEVVEALQTSEAYSTRSLSQPLGHEGATDETMQDVLGVDDRGFAEVEDAALVEAGSRALDERERRIVELRFFEGLTQSEIAAADRHLADARLAPAAARAPHDARPARGCDGGGDRDERRRWCALVMPAKSEYLILARLALAGIAREYADRARPPSPTSSSR